MEAKGCAKACEWKDARRRFYWALRARIARSRALAQITEANPESTPAYRSQLLTQLAPVDGSNMREAAETLEGLDLTQKLKQLRGDHVMHTIRQSLHADREATLEGLRGLLDELSDEEKANIVAAVQGSTRSPGELFSSSHLYLRLT